MLVYITELSKYFITLLMILYCIECALYLIKNNPKKSKGITIRQEIWLFLLQFFAYLTLCLRTGKLDYLFFYTFLQIVIFAMIVLYHMIYPGTDRCLLNNMALLLSIGFIILSRLDFNKAIKQFAIVIASVVIAMVVPYVMTNFPFLKKWKWIYSGIGIFSLLIVLVLGQVTHGSKISYSIAGITMQPSEFVKIVFVFCMASFLYESTCFKNVCISGIIAAIHVLILVASKDLGSALIFFIGYLFILFIASRNYIYLILGSLAGCVAAVISYQLFRHVQVRVQAFMDPFSVIDKEGYQITQSLFAVACGSWFGTGLKKGVPSDIPYVESDFIFSAVSEEMGVIFSIGMLLVCISCFLIFMRTAMKLQSRFYKYLAAGLGVMYIFQVFLTVGGGVKFIPLTGVTLPFVSYGGSSILTSLIIFAIMQGIVLIYNKETIKTQKQIVKNSPKKRTLYDEYDEEDDEEFEDDEAYDDEEE